MTVHRCIVCGSLVDPAAATCRVCGTPVSAGMVAAALADPAPVGRRAAAALVDQLPVLGLLVAATVLLVDSAGWWWVAALGAAIAWTAWLWWWSAAAGSSPGKRWQHLLVVQDSDGRLPPAGPALLRLVVRGGLCLATIGVAGLSVRWDPGHRQRTWWDRICATRVTLTDGDHRLASAAAAARWAPAAVVAPVPSSVDAAPEPRQDPPGPVPVAARSAPRADQAEFLARAMVGDEFHVVPSAPADVVSTPVGTATAAPAAMITGVPPGAIAEPARSADSAAPAAGLAMGSTGVEEEAGRGSADIVWDTGQPVTVSGRILIGRDPSASPGEGADELLSVPADSVGVSKTHLQLDVGASGVTVTDRHSTNGVRVISPDGAVRTCQPGVPVPVRTGDVVHFGGRSLTRFR